MSYSIIQPPFTLRFREMPKKELRLYFKWYMEMIPERIRVLTAEIRRTSGFGSWQPDFTRDTLEPLGDWFASQVELEPRTAEEILEIKSRQKFPIDVPPDDLTNRTFSLAIDIGMYLSQVFLRNHPRLRWDQPFRGKTFVDYGQPVLVKFSCGPFNPVRMVITQAYGLARGSSTKSGLLEVYDIWSKAVIETD